MADGAILVAALDALLSHPIHRRAVSLLAGYLIAALLPVVDGLVSRVALLALIAGHVLFVVVLRRQRLTAFDFVVAVRAIGIGLHGGEAEQQTEAREGELFQQGEGHLREACERRRSWRANERE